MSQPAYPYDEAYEHRNPVSPEAAYAPEEKGDKKEKKELLRAKVQSLVARYEEERNRNEELTMELERLREQQRTGLQPGGLQPGMGPQPGMAPGMQPPMPGMQRPPQQPGMPLQPGMNPLGMGPQQGMAPPPGMPPQGAGSQPGMNPMAQQGPMAQQFPQMMPGMQPPMGTPGMGTPGMGAMSPGMMPPPAGGPMGGPSAGMFGPQQGFGQAYGQPPQGFGNTPPGVSPPNYSMQNFGGMPPMNQPPMQQPPVQQQQPWQQPTQPPPAQPSPFGAQQGGYQPPFPGTQQMPSAAPQMAPPTGGTASLTQTMARVMQTIEQVRAKLHQTESIRNGYGYPQQPAYVDYDTVNLLDQLYDQLGDLTRELMQQRQQPGY